MFHFPNVPFNNWNLFGTFLSSTTSNNVVPRQATTHFVINFVDFRKLIFLLGTVLWAHTCKGIEIFIFTSWKNFPKKKFLPSFNNNNHISLIGSYKPYNPFPLIKEAAEKYGSKNRLMEFMNFWWILLNFFCVSICDENLGQFSAHCNFLHFLFFTLWLICYNKYDIFHRSRMLFSDREKKIKSENEKFDSDEEKFSRESGRTVIPFITMLLCKSSF